MGRPKGRPLGGVGWDGGEMVGGWESRCVNDGDREDRAVMCGKGV